MVSPCLVMLTSVAKWIPATGAGMTASGWCQKQDFANGKSSGLRFKIVDHCAAIASPESCVSRLSGALRRPNWHDLEPIADAKDPGSRGGSRPVPYRHRAAAAWPGTQDVGHVRPATVYIGGPDATHPDSSATGPRMTASGWCQTTEPLCRHVLVAWPELQGCTLIPNGCGMF